MNVYRAKDFQTPALGVVLRRHLVGIQVGRRNYIADWSTRYPRTRYPSGAVTTGRYTGSSKVPATYHPNEEHTP